MENTISQGNNVENNDNRGNAGGNDLSRIDSVENVIFAAVLPITGRRACAATHFPYLSPLSACLQRGDLERGNFGKRLILGRLSVLEIGENLYFPEISTIYNCCATTRHNRHDTNNTSPTTPSTQHQQLNS